MNQTPNSNYRTNESVGKMFLHSCLGKFIILAAVVVVLLIIAFLTKPTDQEMRDEMNDNIMQCMEMNDSIRGDQIDDFVHNIGFIFTTADSTKVGKEWREVFDKYNRLEIYNHAFFRTAYVYNNVKTEGTRVGFGLYGLVIPTANFNDFLLRILIIHASIFIGHFIALTRTKVTNIAFIVIFILTLAITAFHFIFSSKFDGFSH